MYQPSCVVLEVQSDQGYSLIAEQSDQFSSLFATPWDEPSSLNFRVFTVKIVGVQKKWELYFVSSGQCISRA